MEKRKMIKHSGYGTRLYHIWAGMKQRCQNLNDPAFPTYGARGIFVCADWDNFSLFQLWAFENGYDDELSLNRIDNDGPYSPENCCWSTQQEQMRNMRRNKVITIGDETKTMVEWSEDPRCEVSYTTLRARVSKLGWDEDEELLKKGKFYGKQRMEQH